MPCRRARTARARGSWHQPSRPAGLLTALAAALALAACGGAEDETAPAACPPVRDGLSRGANVTAYSARALAAPAAAEALRDLRATGADHVTFAVLWFMDTADASTIEPDPAETPSDASLLAAMSAARALGFTVGVAPHVEVRDGTFRGDIAPADRATWHEANRAMVAHYAELARQGGADLLVVGSELTSTAADADAWRATIPAARARFDGTLTYAANWVQGAEQVRFWDALDAIGVDAYMPLTSDPEPSVDELVAAWRPWVARLRALHERTGLPVRLTEIGYPSRVGAAREPAVEGDGARSEQAQADAYEAAFQAVGHRDWVAGTDVWDWSADGRVEPGGYSPQGKLAATVLARWYGAAEGATACGR